ncbi:MAG: class I SAM-dependent methyltransferase [Oscillochloris sp.]|nr:class I SAM-dependent methyltransferase [Oscillochloris sp.]
MTDSIADPFGNPRGLAGQVAGWLMALSNRQLNTWAVDLLAVRPADHVLEIGFGPGLAVQALARRVRRGQVAGVDISALMVRQATARNGAAVRQGQVQLHEAGVSKMPFGNATFDKVLAVNNVQFWPDLSHDLREVLRVLKPGGLLAIVLQPRRAPSSDDVLAVGEGLAAQLQAVGFRQVRREVADMGPMPAVAVLGTRPR